MAVDSPLPRGMVHSDVEELSHGLGNLLTTGVDEHLAGDVVMLPMKAYMTLMYDKILTLLFPNAN